jgi:hypothetical protein
MANIHLVGTYDKQGAYIVSSTARFVIGKRHKIAPNKPLYYMTYKPLSGEGLPVYISSLFPAENSTYTIEYEGIRYHYVDSGERVTIKKVTT